MRILGTVLSVQQKQQQLQLAEELPFLLLRQPLHHLLRLLQNQSQARCQTVHCTCSITFTVSKSFFSFSFIDKLNLERSLAVRSRRSADSCKHPWTILTFKNNWHVRLQRRLQIDQQRPPYLITLTIKTHLQKKNTKITSSYAKNEQFLHPNFRYYPSTILKNILSQSYSVCKLLAKTGSWYFSTHIKYTG